MTNLTLEESFNTAFEITEKKNLKPLASRILNEANVFKQKNRRDDGYKYVYAAIMDGTTMIASLCINYYPEVQEENSS